MSRPEVGGRESEAGHEMMSNAYGLIMSDLYSPEQVPRGQRRVGPDDHFHAVQLARAGQRHIHERQHRENVEDLTRRFAALSLNDGSVMAVVRNRSIFRTDR